VRRAFGETPLFGETRFGEFGGGVCDFGEARLDGTGEFPSAKLFKSV
jgi:hypothetical protein